MADPPLASTAVFAVSDDQVGAGQLAAKRCRKFRREMLGQKRGVRERYPASQLCNNLDQRRINCETGSPPTELPIACLVESVQSDYAGENEHSGCGYVIPE